MKEINGLTLSESFYREFGEPMIRREFPSLLDKIAVGLIGSGSECYGFDDEISRDHDFEAGFCIFLPSEEVVDRRTAFLLERAYSKLPREYMGFKRSLISPVGGNRHGVLRTGEFFSSRVGSESGELELIDWFYLPEQSLFEATGGRVFYDGLGEVTKIRERLSRFPEDVRLKKLAGELLTMGQSGQYNYKRCALRGDGGAAQLAVFEFVRAAIHVLYLLDNRYMPYYKWSFYALGESELKEALVYLISSANESDEVEKKEGLIEWISSRVIDRIRSEGLSECEAPELEAHAYGVNRRIKNEAIRNKHVLFGV